MKKWTLLLCAIVLTNLTALAQVSFEGSREFGRIFELTYHPTIQNKLYAVTIGSHIVSSNDNGVNWHILYSNPTNYHNIERLKFIDENKISFNLNYGIFDNHLKILNLETNQIIKTYVLPIPQNASRTWITDYAIFPQNTNNAIVSQGYTIGLMSYYRVYYTSNGGTSWNTIYSSIENNSISVNSVAISHDNPGKLFIARGNGPDTPYGGLLISTDSGQTWVEKLAGIPVDPIAINPQNANDILIGTDATTDFENVFRSTDGGLNWQTIPINWEDYVLNSIVHISFNSQNLNSIIVLEENQVIVTNDNFQTFTNTTFEEDPNGYYYGLKASFNPFASNEILVSGNYHPLRSTNGGTSFSKIENPFFNSNQVDIHKQNNIKKHLYYSVQSGYVHKDLATEVQNNYNILPLTFISNEQNHTFIDPNFNGRVYNLISTFSGSTIYISNDHGTTNFALPIPNQFIYTIASQIDNPTKIWVSFYESDLEGNAGSALFEIDFTDQNNIVSTQVNLPAFKPVNSIFIDANNYSNKMIALGSRIYKTTNNGQAWQISSNGLEDFLSVDNDIIFKIVVNPLNQNQLSLATSQGIFTSYDNGNNWIQISTSLVEEVAHSPFINGVIVATSHTMDYSDFNIYYSTNMGEDWNTVSTELLFNPYVLDTEFNFITNAIEIYVATTDIGIIKYTLNIENLTNPSFEINNKVVVYPNPSTDYITVKSEESVIEFDIYDVSGKKVIAKKISTDTLDISNLCNGMYIVKVILDDRTSKEIKFIKE
jgi:xyloglucan-specific exo-beta-1,4-glucanase